MRKYSLTLVVFMIAGSCCLAQLTPYLNNYVQPAPNAAALGKYADYPVSYFTGLPQISIPLYDLKDGSLSIPISLSYHGSGIRVAEVASWVGLGWNLNATGAIIRTVRGAPDEGALTGGAGNARGPRGYYLDSGLRKLPALANPDDPQRDDNLNYYGIMAVDARSLDTEPDLYTFNVGQYSGKFVFDEDRQPRLLTQDNIQIAVNGQFGSWIITVPDGVRYYFGDNNAFETTMPNYSSGPFNFNSMAPSSWFLTKIINPNTRDTIAYTYLTEQYIYKDVGPESMLYNYTDVHNVCNNDITLNIIPTTVLGLRLSTIKSRNFEVAFIANSVRRDVSGNAKALDSIKVYNASNTCIRQYALSMSYFQSTYSSTSPMILTHMNFFDDSTDTRRLKLNSIRELSGDGLSFKPAYRIKYQETLQLPRRVSYNQDHWGFSNNSVGNTNLCLTSSRFSPFCEGIQNSIDSRAPKWPDMASYSLKSIQDPMGALTVFDFEPHKVNNYAISSSEIIGGLRIKKITVTDSLTGAATARTYEYDGGILFNTPWYARILQNEYYLTSGVGTGSVSYRGYTSTMTFDHILKQSSSFVPLQNAQGYHVGYSSVKEVYGDLGQGGSKTYRFQIASGREGDSRLDISNYTSFRSIRLGNGWFSGIFGNGVFNGISAQNLVYAPWGTGNFPEVPNQVNFRNGLLSEVDTYDSSGGLISSFRNTYIDKFKDDVLIRGFKVHRAYVPPIAEDYPIRYAEALAYYNLKTGISQLSKTVNVDYKDGKAFTTEHYYTYEGQGHTLQTSDSSSTSKGESLVTRTFYSFDYSPTADAVFTKMKKRNILVPVATRAWKEGKLVSGTITKFQDFSASSLDTFINPQKIYALESELPLTAAQVGESVAYTAPINTLIPSSVFKERAVFTISNVTGKIVSQKLSNDKTQSILWDTQLSMPMAVVDNAELSDIAYSGFETNEKGNWVYNSSAIATDAAAIDGRKVYILSGSNTLTRSLTSANTYILSYWQKSGSNPSVAGGNISNQITGTTVNAWTYKQMQVSSASSLTISGTGSIDDVRLYPATAQMITYTYDQFLRIVTQVAVNSLISRYEYDSFSRVIAVKDQYGNIVKAFEYNYGGNAR